MSPDPVREVTLADHFARAVRAERARQGMTQLALAQRIGVNVSTLSDLESGRRAVRLDDAVRLCRALGVPLSAMVRDADPADRQALGLD